jgi:hypothetical protein
MKKVYMIGGFIREQGIIQEHAFPELMTTLKNRDLSQQPKRLIPNAHIHMMAII